MKKLLLFSAVVAGVSASAQTFTVNDTLSTGQTTTYYVMDSTASNMAATTGTGVTWNYASLLAYTPTTLTNAVVDASGAPYSASYPTADYNDDLSSGASIYFSNTPDSIITHGYVFSAGGNDIVVKHNVDVLKSMDFPMAVGDSYTDYLEGEADISTYTFPTTGSAVVTVDGFGTLIVGGNTHTNMLRVKLVETIDASITFPFPVTGTITRTLYSYYNLTSDKQALFVHATIDVVSDVLNDNYSAVYYNGTPAGYLGAEENKVITEFTVFPNPSNNMVTITSDGTSQSLNVINALGQIVVTITNPQTSEMIDVAKLDAGVYLVQLNNNGVISEQKLIVE